MRFKLGSFFYIISGIIQWSAVTAILNHALGESWFFITWILAFFVAGIPVIGTISGVAGAIIRWEWPLWLALIMAFGHFVGLGLMASNLGDAEK
jgi:hypothetical protein